MNGYSRYLPLQLKLRAKSTTQSHRAPVYYVHLCLRDGLGLEEAVAQARKEAEHEFVAGVDIQALERAARLAQSNGTFEESEEEAPALIEEFYPGSENTDEVDGMAKPRMVARVTKLTDRLSAKVEQAAGQEMVVG